MILRPCRAVIFTAALYLATGCSAGPATQAPPLNEKKAAIIKFWRLYDAATSLHREGSFEEAARLYAQAIALDPTHEEVLYYLGRCQQELGRGSEAVASFRKLVALNPESSRAHVALGALMASGEKRDLEAAEAHFRKAHAINGEETGPMLRLGETHLARGDIDQARFWLEAAARSNHKCIEAPFLLGYTFWEAGNLEKARAFYAAARQAALPEQPLQGVLGEGDLKVEETANSGKAKPPRTSPMGTTLYGAYSAHLLGEAAIPEPAELARSRLDAIYAPVRQFNSKIREGRGDSLATNQGDDSHGRGSPRRQCCGFTRLLPHASIPPPPAPLRAPVG